MTRRKAREIIFQLLFQIDISKIEAEEAISNMLEYGKMNDEELLFIKERVFGTFLNLKEIDKKISAYLKGWTLNRLAIVDRSILRLSTYELLFVDDVSINVILNEAVELAKKFGTEESPKFINGVLASIVKENKDLIDSKQS